MFAMREHEDSGVSVKNPRITNFWRYTTDLGHADQLRVSRETSVLSRKSSNAYSSRLLGNCLIHNSEAAVCRALMRANRGLDVLEWAAKGVSRETYRSRSDDIASAVV